MSGCARTNTAAPGGDGWLPPAAEAAAYEGIRRGRESAFRTLAEPLQPPLRRFAALSRDDPQDIEALVARAWEIALGGLDMFHWQTPFATWVVGLAVALGRADAVPLEPLGPAALPGSPPPPGPAALPASPPPGPADWRDLPWGARWERAWERLDTSVAELPLPVIEVIHARDVERWSPRRVCDVLGITEAGYDRLLAHGRTLLRDRFADLIAAPPAWGSLHRAQVDAVLRMLRETMEDRGGPLDARTAAVFRRWRTGRGPRWRLLAHRYLPAPG